MATSTDAVPFGQLLRQARTAAALSQEELAERAGLSTRGISDLERGLHRTPHLETVRMLTDALDLNDASRAELRAAARPPPGATAATRAHAAALPVPPTRLVGREREVATLTELLRDDAARLLVLTGPGGSGKTRLAIAVAGNAGDAFVDGIVFVDLAPLADPTLVLATVAHAVGLRASGGANLAEALRVFFIGKHVLLVLDNFEHLLDAAPVVADLLSGLPALSILATSRAPLHLRGEHEYPVSPLALPDPSQRESVAQLIQYDSVRLFVERARAAKPDFAVTDENVATVVQICHRLDGLPLAIELAAARIKLLPPQALLKRMSERLKVLTGGPRDAPARQRTLRDAIAWSHDLLSDDDQTLFRRLSVFAGGCTFEAVEAVANADGGLDTFEGLSSLVNESLLRHAEEPGRNPRFSLLETVREFGLERLAASHEAVAVRQTHATYFADLVEVLRPSIDGPDQVRTVARLEAEHGNLRAALAGAIERADAGTALRLSANLWKYWLVRSHLPEGRAWMERSLKVPGETSPATRIDALYGAGSFARLQGDYGQATAHGEEGLALARDVDDSFHAARSLYLLGLIAHYQGDLNRARSLYEESLGLTRTVNDAHFEAMVLNNLGDVVATAQRDLSAAQKYYEDALAIWRGRSDVWGMGIALLNLGNLALRTGDLARAHELFSEGLTMSIPLGDLARIADYLDASGRLAAATGRWEPAARLLSAATAVYQTAGIDQFPDHHREHERAMSAVRAGLGEEAFAAAEKTGQSLPPEQAVREALCVEITPQAADRG